MKISIITLFPEIFEPILNHSILKRAQEKKLVSFKLINLRDFGIGLRKTVDDRPYGGGSGMVLRVDVLKKAIDRTKLNIKDEKVILLDPQGDVYKQKIAEDLSKLSHMILVCGHYEGFDERVRKYVDLEISIGDFVLTGGEVPAMVLVDSVTRLIPEVLKDENATITESHSEISGKRILEGVHFTRPVEFEGKKIPEILLSGNFKKISEFRQKRAISKTQKKRPDLL